MKRSAQETLGQRTPYRNYFTSNPPECQGRKGKNFVQFDDMDLQWERVLKKEKPEYEAYSG